MKPQTILKQIKEAPKFGKMAYVKDKEGYYCIFSTPDDEGFLRITEWIDNLETAKENIGFTAGYLDDEILKEAKKDNWQVGYIDISEFFDRSGFEEGMKVRDVKNGEILEILALKGDYVMAKGDNVASDYMYKDIEPIYEDEEDDKTEEAINLLKEKGYKIIKE